MARVLYRVESPTYVEPGREADLVTVARVLYREPGREADLVTVTRVLYRVEYPT